MNSYRATYRLSTKAGKTPEIYINVQAVDYGQAEQIAEANRNLIAFKILSQYRIPIPKGTKIQLLITSITFSGGVGNVTPVGSFCADLNRQIVEIKIQMNKYFALHQPAPLALQMKYEKLVALYSEKCNQNSGGGVGGLGGMLGGGHKFSGFDGVDGLIDDLF